MNFEPKNFFIGLMDFFSIHMPGALVTYFAGSQAWQFLLDKSYPLPEGTEGWIVFLFSSYLLGHFIFLIGAIALDEPIYDNKRRYILWSNQANG